MRIERFGRASATNPGKHGLMDWRVEFNGAAPTHSELVWMVGMHLLAERRYNGKGQLGAYFLWRYFDLLVRSKTPEGVRGVAEDCQSETDAARQQRAS